MATPTPIAIYGRDANIAEAIRFILQRDQWRTALHADGEGVLAAVEALEPVLVILDVMLPGMSGLEILRSLRARSASADLPVILLTAKGAAQMRDQAGAAGASAFMAKPFANAELLDTVRRLVNEGAT